MAQSNIAVLSLVVLLALFEIGSCKQCYQCNSQSDVNCGDPFKSTVQPVDCSTKSASDFNNEYLRPLLSGAVINVSGGTKYCHKLVTETGTVLRVCLDSDAHNLNNTCQSLDNVLQVAERGRRLKFCGVCEKDNCNGAGSLSVSLPLAALALVASYLLYRQ